MRQTAIEKKTDIPRHKETGRSTKINRHRILTDRLDRETARQIRTEKQKETERGTDRENS